MKGRLLEKHNVVEWDKGASRLYMPAEDEAIMRYQWKLYLVRLRLFNMVRAHFYLPPIEPSCDIEEPLDRDKILTTFKRSYPVFFNELVEEYNGLNSNQH